MIAEAAVSRGEGKLFSLETIDIAEPVDDEILVEIEAVGVCHADIAAASGAFPVPLPAVLGHEGVGVVRAVGPAVDRFRPGARVVLTFTSCGTCTACLARRPTCCDVYLDLNFFGGGRAGSLSQDGRPLGAGFFGQSSFSTFALASQRNAVAAPADMPAWQLAPMGCATQTGMGAVLDVARPAQGEAVAVTGLGAVGLAAALTASRISGCAVVGVDPAAGRRSLAASLGLTVDERVPARVDLVVECSGNTSALADAIGAVRSGGRVIVVGAPAFGTTMQLDVADVVNRSVGIVGTVEGGSSVERLADHLRMAREFDILPAAAIREMPFRDISSLTPSERPDEAVKLVLTM